MNSISFYFKISKKAKFGLDEKGNAAPCYCQVKVEFDKEIKEEDITKINKEQKAVIKDLSKSFKIDESCIEPVTQAEYIENTEDTQEIYYKTLS